MSSTSEQKKKNAVNDGSASGKAPFSLAVKLNFHAISYTIGVLITINIILCMVVLSFTLWNSEKNIAALVEHRPPHNDQYLDYTFQDTASDDGIALWGIFHQYTPLRDYEISRKITMDRTSSHPLSTLRYEVIFMEEDITVVYHFGNVIERYLTPFWVLLILEALVVLLGIGRNKRSIRKILRPISDMSKQAQNLTSTPIGTMPAEEMKRLRELAGTISNIDATKLDKRLPVDGVQNELKDLASAINSMLNRIDEAYRSQVRFVSDASHELRTPISVIQGYANLLDRWGKHDEATLQEAIDAIRSESESMKDLIEQLLFLARGDNETLHLEPEIFNCSDMIEEILKETQLIDSLHTFRVKAELPALINADRQLMKQAVRILVENSIKYTPDNGEIVVSVGVENSSVRISVQDNGIGINPENLPYIFDRFYRSDESRARKTGGSGLGLAIMKWIIDRHGGSIEVISRKDIGTRTTIILPNIAELPKQEKLETIQPDSEKIEH